MVKLPIIRIFSCDHTIKKDNKFKQFFPANIIEYQFIVGKIKKKFKA